MREIYIQAMEKAVSAYSNEHIRRYTADVEKNGLSEHGFPRLTANLGILIALGRKTELKDDFVKMMNLCVAEIPTALSRKGINVGNNFSVKEIVLCLLEVEKAGILEKTITDGWRKGLSKINPYETYAFIAQKPVKPCGNWAAFGAASEQSRKFAEIGNESEYIDDQIESQLLNFDENGMYLDDGVITIVYDFVTRLQLAVALYFGYDGKCARELATMLEKSADITLYMQSVTGEIPFGGRSNQFLHNDAFYAALCEFYATLFKNKGDIKKAQKFRRAASIATQNVMSWFNENPVSHIKNFYSIDSMYGCEDYAYYDKYMVTTASWFYLAYKMSDDSVGKASCTVECENFICETSEHFHTVILRSGDYLTQIDTNALEMYDANGIGRVHKKGAPSAICLSMPICQKPNFVLDNENPSPFSICGGIKTGKGFVYAYNNSVKYTITEKDATENLASIVFDCEAENGIKFIQKCVVSQAGVDVTVEGDGDVEILVPLFKFDGKNHTQQAVSEKSASVFYKGWECCFKTDGRFRCTEKIFANRNGHYDGYAVVGKNKVTLKIEINKLT